jgi:DNA-binding winged helix-turn-helix (wHTH) protein/TolB-like protein
VVVYRFDSHTFDPDTGELDGPRESLRLQPKPARLLAMLLEAEGELVERDAIRAALWPDTTVDFDAGLNTCVRQIRTALDATGGHVECIETLPKRGYRFVGNLMVERQHAQPTEPPPGATDRLHPGSAVVLPYVVVFVLLAVGTAAVMWAQMVGFGDPAAPDPTAAASGGSVPGGTVEGASAPGAAATAPARLAMLPLIDPDADDPGAFNRALSEAYLTALVAASPDELVVIGPSTTGEPFRAGASPAAIAAALDADFVLHGGYRSGTGVLFLEVITPDGGHVFARRFELDDSAPASAQPSLVTAMAAAIAAAHRDR